MLFKEFRDLRHKADQRPGTPDLLNYAFFGAPSVLVLKDGAMMTCFAYRGPDLNSSSSLELAALKHHTNAILSHYGDGFMLNVDLVRHPSIGYPNAGAFPDCTTALIDRERELHYTTEGTHLETSFTLSLTYRPPPDYQSRPAEVFFARGHQNLGTDRTLRYFQDTADELEQALSNHLRIRRMDDSEMLSFLESCIIGRSAFVRPAMLSYLDAVLGNYRFVAGFRPTIDGRHIRIVAPAGFPLESHAEVTAFLGELPFCYRWSIRAIMLDPTTGVQQLSTLRRNWFQKRLDFKAFLKESFAGSSSSPAFQNQHALDMASDADIAVAEAHDARVRYCYLTMNVIVIEDDAETATAHAQEVRKHFLHHGFPARIEDLNASDAYFGSLPGHGHYNVRKPLLHTQNLADLLPTTAVWAGLETNPCPMYPEDTPALIYASTDGRTPFRYHPHVGDVGHNLVLGPIGSGKSTFLGILDAQAFRVPEMRVFHFDKGYSSFVLTKACGGDHFDIGEDEIAACPLIGVDDAGERTWAQEYLETLLQLQNVRILPHHRKALWRALELLGTGPVQARTFTHLIATVQDQELRTALAEYSITGPLGRFLDADRDALLTGRFITFELETLMAMGPKVLIPVLLYLFHRVDQRLDGRPTLIAIDEAWLMLADQIFGPKIEEWLRTLRKKNASVVLATQSLTEVAGSSFCDVILESCPTKIFLPNPEARNPNTAALYHRFGLSPRQREIIADATPKRHYYYVSPLGRRLFELALEPATLSFVGAGSKEDLFKARRLIHEFGESWPGEWLRTRGLTEWAEAWTTAAHEVSAEMSMRLHTSTTPHQSLSENGASH
jgi:type IV secretion system protein VirB4